MGNTFNIIAITLLTYALAKEPSNETQLYYDYCNIADSKAVYFLMKEITSYYNVEKPTNGTCFLIDEKLNQYTETFLNLEKENTLSNTNVKCPICNKRFKGFSHLNLHFRLFHSSEENQICPGDFCKSLNCDRYKKAFDIKFPDNSKEMVSFNKQAMEKDQVCNPGLVVFYRDTCMKIVKNCFGNDKDKYFGYYENICLKIDCIEPLKNQLDKDDSFPSVLRVVFMYISGILILVYLLIIIIIKYY